MNKRIELILKTKNISASKFADEIGVQRSSISHILSGRNNPSLDFIQKILKRFPDINSSWILTGSGTMYNSPNLFSSEIEYKEENIMDRIINEPVVEHNSESTNITKENKEEEYYKHEEEVKQVHLSLIKAFAEVSWLELIKGSFIALFPNIRWICNHNVKVF